MLDLKFIRENTDIVRQAIVNRHDKAPIDEIISLDVAKRQKMAIVERLRCERKGLAKKQGTESAERGRELRDSIKIFEDELREIDSRLEDLLLRVPNIPQDSVPIGKSEDDNIIISTCGEPRKFDFKPAPHWEIGEKLGIIDFERGVKLSGTRFYVLKGLGSRLQRSLINFMLNLHTEDHGYYEAYLPYMVKKECLIGSSNLPKFADNLYRDIEEDLWLVPTAEVPLTNLHRDEVILPGVLPIYYVAYTACFRREKMSAGKDTRGIKRGHQFDKVEMYKFTEPGNSNDELERMVDNAVDICRKLEIPYRIKKLCTADLSFASTKTYDIEMWAPGCSEWLEVSSCSNCGDFQARRANIRYRPTLESKPQLVHTLNGSGLALPRVVIAVIENYQQADGSISVPKVLQPYMDVKVIK
ncbi:MAG: serine--tRNA ligase [Dehalococcoidales bacterium]|nr:serine--tRNA ligase [Dehalococcoidales bacterium]